MPKIYDADQVTAAFFGFLIDSGFDDGEFIRIEHANPRVTAKEGTDGEIVRSKTNSKLVTITITLMQTSEANSKLAAVAELDDKAHNGAGVGPFMIRDKSGTALHAGTAWISEMPDPTYDREATNRVWKLQGECPVDFPGGS